jgi:hypothetical protein
VSRVPFLTISICKKEFQMETQKSEGNVPSLVVPAQSLTPSSSKALELASSLIDTGAGGEVTRDEMATLPVDKPSKTQFFRIHPNLYADVNILKVDGINGTERYAVVPSMVKSLDGVSLCTLFFGVHRDGSYFLWPVNATSSDGYSRSGRQIAIAAMKQWCRLVCNRAASEYIKRVAPHCEDVPVWPEDKTFPELLAFAFGEGHIIDSPEHPVVKEMWLK